MQLSPQFGLDYDVRMVGTSPTSHAFSGTRNDMTIVVFSFGCIVRVVGVGHWLGFVDVGIIGVDQLIGIDHDDVDVLDGIGGGGIGIVGGG
jgi:hypothetical protein